MSATFATPILDAQIALLPRYADRLAQSKEILTLALAKGSIYATDLQAAKDGIVRAADYALDALRKALRVELGDAITQEQRGLLWDAVPLNIQLNHVRGNLAKADKAVSVLPGLHPIVELLRELQPLVEAYTELKPNAIKGRKPLENPKPVDHSNTGTCSCCQNTQKLTSAQTLVHHGFHISDGRGHYLGFRTGRCYGVGYRPYELSNEGNIAYAAKLREAITATEEYIAKLNAGEVQKITRTEVVRENGVKRPVSKTYLLGDLQFPKVQDWEINQEQNRLAGLTWELERQELLIKNWSLKSLPGQR